MPPSPSPSVPDESVKLFIFGTVSLSEESTNLIGNVEVRIE
jgi:hypothetical protein